MSTILGFILFFAILVPLLIFALVAYIVRSVTGNSLTGFIIEFVVCKFFMGASSIEPQSVRSSYTSTRRKS